MTMIEIGTWLAVIILGPGAALIFIWFLRDFIRMMRHTAPKPAPGRNDPA